MVLNATRTHITREDVMADQKRQGRNGREGSVGAGTGQSVWLQGLETAARKCRGVLGPLWRARAINFGGI